MPIVRKETGGPPAKVKTGRMAGTTPSVQAVPKGRAKAPMFELPQERSAPTDQLGDYTWLIYGPKKIGKTSLAAQMDTRGGKVLFCMFEPGGKALSIYRTPVITDWGQFKNVVSQLEEDKQGYTTVVIDPGATAYKRCLEYVCRSLGIMHPGRQKDYGASWDRVNTEFQEIHGRIAALDMGFIVLAHDKDAEIERRDGSKFNKTVPVMSGSTEEFYAGVIDIICYYEYVGDRRFLRIRGDEYVSAGCRLDDHFRTPKGERVQRIPAGDGPEEAWANIILAFKNQQAETYATV
jgi:hypothetical protein